MPWRPSPDLSSQVRYPDDLLAMPCQSLGCHVIVVWTMSVVLCSVPSLQEGSCTELPCLMVCLTHTIQHAKTFWSYAIRVITTCRVTHDSVEMQWHRGFGARNGEGCNR